MDIEKQVGEKTYSFQKLKVKQAIAGGLPENMANWQDQDIASIVGGIMAGLEPEEVADFIESTIRGMVVMPAQVGKNGTSETFEVYYQEHEDELYEAFYVCVELQSGSIISFLKKKLMGSEKITTDSLQEKAS
jgi:hypothetical protein